MLNGYTNWERKDQKKLIVYNVPQHQAVDFTDGNEFRFIGDSILTVNGMLANFHLKPARIALQLTTKVNSLSTLYQQDHLFLFNNKKILFIDKSIVFEQAEQKIDIDYIIVSKGPKLYISQLAKVFNCSQYIFDGSNSLWKIANWKKDCEQLHLRCYSVPEQGAFVVDL
jgi:competence protein ComEC